MVETTLATLLTSAAASPRRTIIRAGLGLVGAISLVVAAVVILGYISPMVAGGPQGALQYGRVQPLAPAWLGVAGLFLVVVLAVSVLAISKTTRDMRVWAAFILCLAASGAGVALSLAVFGTTITGYRLWGAGIAVAIIMLGVGYAAKYSNQTAAASFTPMDLVQFLSQGFLWPSAWPAFAERLGVERVAPPVDGAASLLEFVRNIFIA